MLLNQSELSFLKVFLEATIQEESFSVVSIDSYKHPFDDFYEQTTNILNSPYSSDKIRLFIIAGQTDKIKSIRAKWDRKIKSFFKNFSIYKENKGGYQINKTSLPSIELLMNLFIKSLVDSDKLHYPNRLICRSKNDEDIGFLTYYWKENPEIDIYHEVTQILDLWIAMETPHLKGHQVVTKSFNLNKLKGRKIIAALPEPQTSNWGLLLEGGIFVPISESFEDRIDKLNRSHIGRWTVGEVEDILQNPVYYLGRHYEPYDLFLEWKYVLIYSIACFELLDYNDPSRIHSLYEEDFLKFIERNVCTYLTAPTLFNLSKGRETFLQIISQVKSYLVGEEETGISKNILMLMRSRYCYLPFIYSILQRHFNLDEKLKVIPFITEDWTKILNQLLSTTSTYNKGLILEDVAAYFVECIPGLKVSARRKRGEREEVDLYVCNTSLSSILWEMGPVILVECKNHKNRTTVADIRNFVPIMDSKGIKSALIFGFSGFTRDAKKEIENQYLNGKVLIAIDMTELLELSDNNTPEMMINRKLKILMRELEDDIRLAY